MEDDVLYSPEYTTDPDLSFTDRAFTATSSSSARTSFAKSSSLSLSFNDRLSAAPSTAFKPAAHHRPHRRQDPQWSAIREAASLSPDGRLHLRQLKLLRPLGSGDHGRVFLCRLQNHHFALKVVDRHSLSSKKLSHIETEAHILSMLDHPFLPTLYAHISASHYTCLLIDYCSGGDLHSLLRRQPLGRLPLRAVRFYAAEILVALEYLHSMGIVYRDLKPENILLRENGHIMLSDFDLCFTTDLTARIEPVQNRRKKKRSTCCGVGGSFNGEVAEEFVAEPTGAFSKSCVGTHEYLSPELVGGNGHGSGVDWWAFGVLIYELLYGTTPFKGVNKQGTLRNILSKRNVVFPVTGGGGEWAAEEKGMGEVRDLIGGLLVKDPRRRLGCTRGAAEIKRQPFFEGVKWPLIRSCRPPQVGGVGRKRRRRKWWWRGLCYFMKKSSRSLQTKYYK